MKFFDWFFFERVPITEIQILNPRKELKIFCFYATFYIFVVFLFSLLIKFYPLQFFKNAKFTDDLWYILFVKIVFLFFLPVAIYRHQGYSISSLFNLVEASKISVLFPFFVGFIINFSHISRISPLFNWSSSFKIILGIVFPLITAAIPEEIFYRRILQTRIEKLGGWFLSIIGSSFFFSLFHFPSRYLLSTGVEGVAGDLTTIFSGTVVPTFVLGLIFGILWNRYRNIFLLIALHYGIDLLPSVSSLLGVMK